MSRSRRNELYALAALAALALLAVALLAFDAVGVLGGWLAEPVDVGEMR